MTIFPIMQPQITNAKKGALPICRDAEWDYKTNTPVWKNGSPSFVTGAPAVLSWAWRAMQTERCRHEPHGWGYGHELESLIGKGYSTAVQQAEAVRYVRECLLVNPYITDVENIVVGFVDDHLSISCKLVTIYGEVDINGI